MPKSRSSTKRRGWAKAASRAGRSLGEDRRQRDAAIAAHLDDAVTATRALLAAADATGHGH
jgi:hypothetical protein